MDLHTTTEILYLDNDPCHHCVHYCEDYDRHTGITDCDCGYEYGFHEEFGKIPCPGFKPLLASDGLFEQLFCEAEERFCREQEEWARKCAEED